MSFRLRVDAGSVTGAASAVRAAGGQLDDAPGGAALRTVAAAVPGGELARAAAEEAGEWTAEMSELGAVLERYARQLQRAVTDHRDADAAGATGLRTPR